MRLHGTVLSEKQEIKPLEQKLFGTTKQRQTNPKKLLQKINEIPIRHTAKNVKYDDGLLKPG